MGTAVVVPSVWGDAQKKGRDVCDNSNTAFTYSTSALRVAWGPISHKLVVSSGCHVEDKG